MAQRVRDEFVPDHDGLADEMFQAPTGKGLLNESTGGSGAAGRQLRDCGARFIVCKELTLRKPSTVPRDAVELPRFRGQFSAWFSSGLWGCNCMADRG